MLSKQQHSNCAVCVSVTVSVSVRYILYTEKGGASKTIFGELWRCCCFGAVVAIVVVIIISLSVVVVAVAVAAAAVVAARPS